VLTDKVIELDGIIVLKVHKDISRYNKDNKQ
jgi:hypothetical protein